MAKTENPANVYGLAKRLYAICPDALKDVLVWACSSFALWLPKAFLWSDQALAFAPVVACVMAACLVCFFRHCNVATWAIVRFMLRLALIESIVGMALDVHESVTALSTLHQRVI